MKKLLILIIAFVFLSCEKQDTYCFECEKQVTLHWLDDSTYDSAEQGLMDSIAEELQRKWIIGYITMEEMESREYDWIVYTYPLNETILIRERVQCELFIPK